jgi:hypothetical protein
MNDVASSGKNYGTVTEASMPQPAERGSLPQGACRAQVDRAARHHGALHAWSGRHGRQQ